MARKKTQHHRKPKSIGGSDESRNISWVKDRQHKAWHTLFSNYPAWKIAFIINKVWLDPDYVLKLEKRETVDPNQLELPFK